MLELSFDSNALLLLTEPILKLLSIVFTLAFVWLSVLVHRKTQHWGWLIVSLFLYLYCLHPFILAEVYWAFGVKAYWFGYPYFVEKNKVFYASWSLHSFLCSLYLFVVWLFVKKQEAITQSKSDFPFRLSYFPLVVGLFAQGLFIILWWPWLRAGIENCTSLYLTFKRGEPLLGNAYPLSRILLSLSCLAVSFQLLTVGWEIRKGSFSWVHLFSMGTAILLFILCTLLGDKNAWMSGILFSSVLFSNWYKRRIVLFTIFLVSAITLNWIGLVRYRSSMVFCGGTERLDLPMEGAGFNEKLFSILNLKNPLVDKPNKNWATSNVNLLVRGTLALVDSGEFVTAFSTYALINKKVPLSKGDSLRFLFYSLPPKILGISRPENPQDYFARNVGIMGIMGWGLNYFTDWLMNFGLLGGLFGSLLLACLHVTSFNLSENSLVGKIFFSAIVATLPLFLRSGILFREPVLYAIFAVFLLLSNRIYSSPLLIRNPLKHIRI